MVDPANSQKSLLLPTRARVIQGFSRLSGLVGAIIFLLGDAFLYEIKHLSFFASTVIGIGGGVLLMLLGWAIASAGKSPNTDRHFRGMISFSLLPFAFVAQVFAPYANTCGF